MSPSADEHEFQASEPAAGPQARPSEAAPRWEADPHGLLEPVLAHMAEAVMVVDAHGEVVRLNRASRLKKPWLSVGMNARELDARIPLYTADGRTRVAASETPVARVLRGETLAPTEYVVAPPGRPAIVLSISGTPLRERGCLVGAVFVSVDVTPRRQLEDRFEALFQGSALATSLQDAEGRFVATNARLRRMLGYSAAVLAQLTAADITEPPGYAREHALRMRLLSGEIDSYELELQVRAKDGRRLWISKAVSRFPVVADEAGLVICMAQDITARVEAEQALKASEALLSEAERSAGFGSWRLDVRTGEVAWSDGMFRLLGYEPGAITPSIEAYLARLHPTQRAALWYDEAEISAGRVPPGEDHLIIRADGEERVLRFSGHIEHDEAGLPIRSIGTAQDVTEKVRGERAKADFLAVVSHEMRTPLTIIRAPLRMFQSGMLDPNEPQGRAMLDLAVQGVERMTRLVGDIQDLQRLDSGQVSMRLAPVAGADLVAGAVEPLRQIAAQAGVSLRVEAEAVSVEADQDRVIQVLTNLIENAIKFSPGGGTIPVTLERTDDAARFSVTDQGPGIPRDQREAIFERYVQLGEKCTRPASGIGLGLAIAREIVAFHGGRIWVEARPGGGSTFRFTLPLAQARPGRRAPRARRRP